jgi:UDP:flavonoid glycosyltransferase YjiC (YdhE family)
MDLLDKQLAALPETGEVVYAVLDWGLGHATRSSVIIRRLLDAGRTVTIAADGQAMAYLRDAFPDCKVITLPAYDVTYTRTAALLPWHLATQVPRVLRSIRAERRQIADYVEDNQVAAIISDNRYGCYHPTVPSYLLTHQLQLLVPGVGGWLANRVLTRWLQRFDTVCVPDDPLVLLSGKLSHHPSITPAHIGVLSSLQRVDAEQRVDVLLALSGPEPQRTLLEEGLVRTLVEIDTSVQLVRGTRSLRTVEIPASWRVIDFADAQQMSAAFAAASLVICRSGYSTIMDLHHLGKRAILIPTPGQPEQEYLAEWVSEGSGSYRSLSQKDIKKSLAAWVDEAK